MSSVGFDSFMMVLDQPGDLVALWTKAQQTKPALRWTPLDDAYPAAWWRPDTLRLRRTQSGAHLLCAPMRPGAMLCWELTNSTMVRLERQESTRLTLIEPAQRVIFDRPIGHRPPGTPGGATS